MPKIDKAVRRDEKRTKVIKIKGEKKSSKDKELDLKIKRERKIKQILKELGFDEE